MMQTADHLLQAEPPQPRPGHAPGPGERLTPRDWKLALAVALLAGLAHLLLANQRGYWGDEYLTVLSARLGLLEQCRERLAQGHSPLYFIFARLGHLFGECERAFRFPSALATVFTMLGLTGLAGALGWRRRLPALWGLALLQPFWITLGTQARYMMPLMAIGAFTMWAAVLYVRNFERRPGAALALALGLLLWTHSSAQFFALGLLAFVAWEAYARAPREGAAALRTAAARLWPVLLGILSSAPLLYLTRHHSNGNKTEFPGMADFLRDLCEVLFGDYKLWPRFLHWSTLPVLIAALALLAVVARLAARALRRREATAARLLAALAIFTPLGFFLFCGLVRNFGSPARYISLFSLPVVLAMAAAWHAPLRRPLRLAFRVALAGFLAVQAAATALERGDHHREACRWIVQHATPGVSLVLVSGPANRLGLELRGLKKNIDVFVRDASRPETSSFPRLLQAALRKHPRVLFINYFNPNSIVDDIDAMVEDKTILARRRWRLGLKTTVGAFIRDERDRPWLDGLPKPEKDWGPARYD